MTRWHAVLVCAVWLVVADTSSEGAPPPPKSPTESLRAIQLRPGMQVELVASEPLVEDPIAISWSADGRMWVVEMGDYPLGLDGKGGAGGRIRVLEDTDGDGRYDKAQTFLDKLGFPTGVLPWRKGVLVTCAPDIFYVEDTDGDGKADRREVLFSGFPQRNQQHRVNGLQWGLDNWVHCANGDGGVGGTTVIECRKQGGKRIELGGRDFRFRPDTGELDPQTGTTQFGRNRDDWGNWFGSNNAQPLYHFVLGDEYLRRNPQLAPPDPRRHLLTVQGPFFGMAANVPIRGESVPTGPGPYRVELGGPCSGMIYRDTLLGAEFTGNVFVCDPVTNLVHREILAPRGVTYSSQRAADETAGEFFASRDSWTRPTMVRTGPDGALWVVDMYRLVIEHPQWISPSAKRELDLRAGQDLGRIYRVWPTHTQPRKFPRLDKLATVDLVAALDAPGGWQRDMAQQLLVWRADADAVAPLEKLVQASANPLARLQALCTLEGLGRLSLATLELALQDSHAEIRRNALRLAEPFLRSGKLPVAKLLPLLKDPSAPVRLQLACSLGESADKQLVEILVDVAAAGGDDTFLNAAVLSSVRPQDAGEMLARLLSQGGAQPRLPQLLKQTATLAGTVAGSEEAGGAKDEQALTGLFTSPQGGYAPWQLDALAAWFEGRGLTHPLSPSLRQRAEPLFQAARKLAEDPRSSVALRIAAVGLLGRDPATQQSDVATLSSLVSTRIPPDVQLAAVERMSRIDDGEIPRLLLQNWSSHGPAVRARILDALLSRNRWAVAIMEGLEAGTLDPTDVDAPRRQRLRDHSLGTVSGPARKMFIEPNSTERRMLLDSYRTELAAKYSKSGNALQGKATFERRCAVCHRLGSIGQSIGPDLTSYTRKPVDEWLIAVLDPNRAVEPRYASYTATTARGLSVSGLIATETASSLTLLGSDARPQTLLRTEIEELRNSGKSLMPEGLEKDLPPAEMANLLAFVRSVNRRQRKVVAGNQPELVRPEVDGSLRLLPANCEIYGDKVGVNPQENCIAWMSTNDDLLIWNVETPRSGKFQVQLQWAQVAENDGNRFQLELGHQKVAGTLAKTGGWSQYRSAPFGPLEIPAGRGQILLRAIGPVKGELADLREIRLIPVSP